MFQYCKKYQFFVTRKCLHLFTTIINVALNQVIGIFIFQSEEIFGRKWTALFFGWGGKEGNGQQRKTVSQFWRKMVIKKVRLAIFKYNKLLTIKYIVIIKLPTAIIFCTNNIFVVLDSGCRTHNFSFYYYVRFSLRKRFSI